MKEIYKKTITSIFIMPTLNINRKDLHDNNFLNAYIGDINKEEYHQEDVVFLLFNPENLNIFRNFLNFQYETHKDIIDDYDYSKGFIVLVYSLDKSLKEDFNLIKQGKYSEVSDEFKKIFPKNNINYAKANNPKQESLQHLIFNKNLKLLNFWEKELDTELISKFNLEIWRDFDTRLEVLDIEKIIQDEKNKTGH